MTKKQESIEEIFTELNSKPTSAARRLALLNAFVKLINSPANDELSTYTSEEILIRYGERNYSCHLMEKYDLTVNSNM